MIYIISGGQKTNKTLFGYDFANEISNKTGVECKHLNYEYTFHGAYNFGLSSRNVSFLVNKNITIDDFIYNYAISPEEEKTSQQVEINEYNTWISELKKIYENEDNLVITTVLQDFQIKRIMKDFKDDILVINLVRDINSIPFLIDFKEKDANFLNLSGPFSSFKYLLGSLWSMYNLSFLDEVRTIQYEDYTTSNISIDGYNFIYYNKTKDKFSNEERSDGLLSISLKKQLKIINDFNFTKNIELNLPINKDPYAFTNLIAKRFGYQEIK